MTNVVWNLAPKELKDEVRKKNVKWSKNMGLLIHIEYLTVSCYMYF